MLTLLFLLASAAAAPTDWRVLFADSITALSPVLIPVAIYYFRLWQPRVPRVLLPLLAVLLGVLVQWVDALASASAADPLAGAVLGLSAVVLREVWNTAREHGLDGTSR